MHLPPYPLTVDTCVDGGGAEDDEDEDEPDPGVQASCIWNVPVVFVLKVFPSALISRVAVRLMTVQLSGTGVVEPSVRVSVNGVFTTIACCAGSAGAVAFVVVAELPPSEQYSE